MIKIIVKGWNNGSQNYETGGGYGIKIADKKDRESYFQKEWTSVTIELEGEGEIEVNLSCAFWTTCEELRKKEIGKWMINNNLAPWPKGHPASFEFVPISNRRFRLRGIKSAHHD